MTDDARRIMMYDAHKKSVVLAYFLWFFLGSFGVHRFYLKSTLGGLAQLLLLVVGAITAPIGIGHLFLGILGLWWLLDAFLIPGINRKNNLRLASRF